jgi:hypothetical protein
VRLRKGIGTPSAPEILFEHLLRSTQIKKPLYCVRDPCEHGHARHTVLKVVPAPRPTVAPAKLFRFLEDFVFGRLGH